MTTHNEENRLYRIRIKTFQKNQQSLHARKKKLGNGRNLISKVTALYDFKCQCFNN